MMDTLMCGGKHKTFLSQRNWSSKVVMPGCGLSTKSCHCNSALTVRQGFATAVELATLGKNRLGVGTEFLARSDDLISGNQMEVQVHGYTHPIMPTPKTFPPRWPRMHSNESSAHCTAGRKWEWKPALLLARKLNGGEERELLLGTLGWNLGRRGLRKKEYGTRWNKKSTKMALSDTGCEGFLV